MNVKTKQAPTESSPRLWPWLAVAILIVPIGLLLKMGASDNHPAVTAPPVSQQAVTTVIPPMPTEAMTPVETIEIATPDGIVDPVPAVTHLPVASGDVPNEQKIHAGDDSVFVNDDDGKTDQDEDKDDEGGA